MTAAEAPGTAARSQCPWSRPGNTDGMKIIPTAKAKSRAAGCCMR